MAWRKAKEWSEKKYGRLGLSRAKGIAAELLLLLSGCLELPDSASKDCDGGDLVSNQERPKGLRHTSTLTNSPLTVTKFDSSACCDWLPVAGLSSFTALWRLSLLLNLPLVTFAKPDSNCRLRRSSPCQGTSASPLLLLPVLVSSVISALVSFSFTADVCLLDRAAGHTDHVFDSRRPPGRTKSTRMIRGDTTLMRHE